MPRFPLLAVLTALLCFLPLAARAQILSEPLIQTPPEEMRTPAPGALYVVPVVSICYLPTRDGVNLDPRATDLRATLAGMYDKITMLTRQIKFSLEEGSRYHGDRSRSASPSLGYKIVAMITITEDVPRDPVEQKHKMGTHQIDYQKILERFGGQDWVDNQGVKEFWVWSYHYGDLEVAESNMSSPLTGDISNSERRNDDLPIYHHTYVVYNYNYERSEAEAVHDHGHQLEAELNYINQKQDGNTKLFGQQFMGFNDQGKPMGGRVGWTHMPPNTPKDYDYQNKTPILSDIFDWTPNGSGRKVPVAANTWGDLSYAWPDKIVPEQKTEAQWYIFWRQNIPGLNNNIDDDGQTLTNWWQFVGDWDGAIVSNVGLHEGPLKTPYVPK